MGIKRNTKLLITDLKYTNGFVPFMNALMHSIFVLGILVAIVWAICTGWADFPGVCAGLMLAFFILGNFGRDKKIESMEKTIRDDKSLIEKMTKKDKGLDYNDLNRQMKEFQDE